ncbi:group 1 glycosyl transferase [Calothrix sp. NIES-2100]|uniref:glycosyltransferase family 4 protein n=1 Tax=Calothrix sp. NIES-2100 TaxID=1954172 RepID=UPI000B60E445|nr:group 1 glycosyl transferase [Calothrix sp. NIES-2100]
MKIAVIGAKGLPPKQGGIEHYCAEVYPRIVAKGHSVDLYARSSTTDSSPFSEYDFEGVRVVSLPGPRTKGLDAFFSSMLGAMMSVGNRYDIVHFHALGPALFTWMPKLSLSTKVVVTCQGLDWQRNKWGKLSSNLILQGEKAAVRFADGLIVVSEELRSYFRQTYGKQSVYIPNAAATYGASDPTFAYGQSLGLTSGRYVLFLGRLVPEKCPDLLIEAFKKLKPAGWKLVLAGGVSDTKDFTSQMLQQVANDPDIIFAGELRGARLWEIVRGAGLFALPSDLEGLPLAMLEAMSQAIPVLASDIPPHQQLISSNRGVMFRAGNLDSLVQQMDWAVQHPQEMKQMAENAQRNVQVNYSWEKITADNLSLYENLLNTPGQRAGEKLVTTKLS